MNTKTLQKFVALNEQIKTLEVARDELRETIVAEMRKNKLDKAETPYGIFTRAVRVSWEYTEAVLKLKEKVKVAELKEQKAGVAKSLETEYLRFTAAKE